MDIFCLKCKKRTPSLDEKKTTTKNGRNIIKAICAECGSKKNIFVK